MNPEKNGFGIALLFVCVPSVLAQPTYKLGVGSHLMPTATLKLQGTAITRSTVRDDPGFRMQYHFIKDGKTLAVEEARGQLKVEIPKKDPGIYTVVLEVFYPAYKGGNDQKGKFQAISPYLTYQVTAGNPPQVKVLEPVPALTLLCGKDQGKGQEQKVTAGYGYKLLQGAPAEMAKAAKPHAWSDSKQVRFEITLPAETPGSLRLHFSADDSQGKQKVTVLGRTLPELADFSGPGKILEVHLTAQDTKVGKIDVVVDNLQTTGSATVSLVEWLTPPR